MSQRQSYIRQSVQISSSLPGRCAWWVRSGHHTEHPMTRAHPGRDHTIRCHQRNHQVGSSRPHVPQRDAPSLVALTRTQASALHADPPSPQLRCDRHRTTIGTGVDVIEDMPSSLHSLRLAQLRSQQTHSSSGEAERCTFIGPAYWPMTLAQPHLARASVVNGSFKWLASLQPRIWRDQSGMAAETTSDGR